MSTKGRVTAWLTQHICHPEKFTGPRGQVVFRPWASDVKVWLSGIPTIARRDGRHGAPQRNHHYVDGQKPSTSQTTTSWNSTQPFGDSVVAQPRPRWGTPWRKGCQHWMRGGCSATPMTQTMTPRGWTSHFSSCSQARPKAGRK